MGWLQDRLNELNYTHEDLRHELDRRGIERSRAAITGWTNGNSTRLLCNPEEAKILADALKWSVLDLLIAAGYDIDIKAEILPLIQHYNTLDTAPRRRLFLLTLRQFIEVASILSDKDVDEAIQDAKDDNSPDRKTS